jgi:hypothetical protein
MYILDIQGAATGDYGFMHSIRVRGRRFRAAFSSFCRWNPFRYGEEDDPLRP